MQPERRDPMMDESSAALAAKHPSQYRADRMPCRVLVVDDDELVRTRLAVALRSANYEVELAQGGPEALRILASRPCDIVLTDWEMPVVDGLDLCRHVRAMERDSYVYLMLFTIRRSHDDLLKGFAAGVDDYVVKGASIEEVLSRIDTGRRITQRTARSGIAQATLMLAPQVAAAESSLAYLAPHLRREFDRAERYGHALSILRLEFEGIHLGNERVLGDIAALAQGSLRKCDWFARTYDNEFMLVLPETAFAGARRVAAKLQEVIAFHLLSILGGETLEARIEIITVKPKLNQSDRAVIDSLLEAVKRRESAAASQCRCPAIVPTETGQAPSVREDFPEKLH